MYIQIAPNDTPFRVPLMTKKPANIQVMMRDFNNNSATLFENQNSLQYNNSDDYYLLREKETLGEKDSQYIKILQNDYTGVKSNVYDQFRDASSQKSYLADSVSPNNKNREPKINLEFLKCYWKKDYRKLAKIIQMNKMKNQKELPFLVTSYSKNLSAEQRFFKQEERPSLEERTINIKPQKYDPFLSARNDQQILSKRSSELDLSYAKFKENILSKKKLDDEKTLTNKLKTEGSEISIPKDSPAQLQGPQVGVKRMSKNGYNLKQNIKKNQYKNLDTMLEQNNIFYLKYEQDKIKKKQNMKEIKNFNEVLSQSRLIAQNVEDSHSLEIKKKKTKIRSNFVKFQETNDQIFQLPRKPTLPLALSPIYEFKMRGGQISPNNGRLQAGSESEQGEEQEMQVDQFQNSVFGTKAVQRFQRQRRQTTLPSLILIIQVEGVLAFKNDSYFGFQTDHPNYQFFTETVHKMFHQINVSEFQRGFYVYKSIKEVLLSLSRAYVIVLILKKDNIELHNTFCKYIQEQQIWYDGLYFQEDGQFQNSFVTDYSPIISEFYLSSPKMLVTVNPIDIDEVKDLYCKKNPTEGSRLYGSYSTNKADSFIQNAKVLKQSYFGFENSSLFFGAFPLASLCGTNNIRSLLIPKINYRRIVTMLRSNMSIPTLEKLEQVCLAVMTDYSFLNLLYNYKHNLFRCSFSSMFEHILIVNKQFKHRNFILNSKLKKLFMQASKDLENEIETYTQEQGEQVMIESKKQLFANFQVKLQKVIKKNRSQAQTITGNEELKLDDVSLKVQGLIEEMYSRNKGILKSMMKHRIKVKQRLQTYESETLEIPHLKNHLNQEIQFCNHLSQHMLFCVNIS